jgi:outer membrane protein
MKRYIFLIMLLPVFLAANEYTLDQLVEYGLEHSYQIRRQELSDESSKSALNSSKWNMLPEVDLSLGVNQDLDPISPKSGLTNSAGFGINKTISLNDPAYFNYRQALLDRDISQVELEQAYSNYAYQVVQAYIEVLSSTKRRSALEENLAIQTRVYEQSQVLLQLGKTTPFELKQNEIAVMNSRISILQLDNTIQNTRARLFSLVQMQDEGFPLAELPIDISKQIPEYSADKLAQIKVLEHSLRKNDLNLNKSKLEFLPRLNLSYGFSRSVSGEDFEFDNYNTQHSLGLNLSYSIWNFFTNKENNTRYKISKQNTLLSIEDARDQNRRAYDNAVTELQYLLRLDELYLERLQQSTKQIQIAEERYRLGMIQLLELDKTRTEYVDSDIQYNSNRYQIIQKQEEINHLLSNQILGKW